MKKSLLILSTLVFVSPSVAVAEEDGGAFYMQTCVNKWSLSEPYCSCALQSFSEEIMRQDKEALPQYESAYEETHKWLLSQQGMTQGKIDAVCDLYDQFYEYDKLGYSNSAGDSEAFRENTQKKIEAIKQAQSLSLGYKLTGQHAHRLTSGAYCADKRNIALIKKGLAEYDGGVYLGAKEKLDEKSESFARTVAHNYGREAKCAQ